MTDKRRRGSGVAGCCAGLIILNASLLGVGPESGDPPVVNARDLAADFGGEKAVTQPSKDAVMGFMFPVEISEVVVKGGQRVSAGDLLVRARADEITAAVALAELLANSDHDVRRAQAALELAQIQHASVSESYKQGGANKFELDQAENAVKRAEIDVGLYEVQLQQRRITADQRRAEYERYRLVAPFDGVVDVVIRQRGQAVNESEPVVRVVDIDPLWIDVPTPTAQTLTLDLKPGAPAWVMHDVPGEPRVYEGRVIEVAAVADVGSDTRRVRVEVANPDGWPAGMAAWVRFTEPTGEWAERIRKAETADGGDPEGVAEAPPAPAADGDERPGGSERSAHELAGADR